MLKSVVAGVALGAFGLFGTAEASIVTVSYYGQLASGTDTNNAFGTGNTDLSGQFMTLTYVFDTSKGVHSFADGTDQVSGYSFLNQQSPALSAAVTLNNTTISFAGIDSGYITATAASGHSLLSQSAQYDTYTYASSELDAPAGTFPNAITHVLSLTLGSAGEPTAFGSFSLNEGDVQGFFNARSISVSAVPLPSALPLFGLALAGLGAGAALRKRRGLRASQ